MARLARKIAIITGGAGGIGLATAKRFVQEGAQVLLVDLEERALKEAADSVGSDSISIVAADVTDPEQVQFYVQTAVERYGGIDILLNNAGIEGEVKPITEASVEMFDQVMAVNVRGVWLGMKYVIPEMEKRGGGSIVITSSMAGISGAPNFSPYSASKHAVVGIMRSLAAECAHMGIRVNTVNPGLIQTRMTDSLAEQNSPADPDQFVQDLNQRIPLGRYGRPEEVADLMLFLASDESSYCTGGTYGIDGGIPKRR